MGGGDLDTIREDALTALLGLAAVGIKEQDEGVQHCRLVIAGRRASADPIP